MARSRGAQALAVRTDRVARGCRAAQSLAHFRGHGAISVVSEAMAIFRVNPKGDELCRANALATSAALLQERESDDRKAVPHALDFGRTFTEKAGTLGNAWWREQAASQSFWYRTTPGNAAAAAEPVTFSSWKTPALRVYDARVSTTSNFCPPGTRCSRAAPRQKVRATAWWCASARPGAAMNDNVYRSRHAP